MKGHVRGAAATVLVVTTLLWSLAPPAFAHEFTVVVVSTRSVPSEDARRGFQVAVDESPDVSHGPGADAGDHLGGVDVDLVAVDDGENPLTTDRVVDLLDAGASAVVVLLVPSMADAIGAAAAERDKLALVVGDGPASSEERALLLLRPRGPAEADEVRVDGAKRALRDALGDEPTPAALIGYDAGRVLDKIVAQVGEDLQPSERLTTAALAASADLASSRVVGVVGGSEAGERTGEETTSGTDVATAVAVAAAALVAAGAVVLIKRRRLK